MQNIAIGFDNTIADTKQYYLNLIKQGSEKYGYEEYFVKHYDQYRLEELAHDNPPLIEGAKEFLDYLVSKKYYPIILSARDDRRKKQTKKWLASNQIQYSKLVLNPNKHIYCIEHNIKTIIDDSPMYANLAMQNNIRAFMPLRKAEAKAPKGAIGFISFDELYQYF